MADLNIIERANKILTFRKYIREECRKKGLEYPSDEKIAEYIADCGGEECVYDLNDFMGDYENKIGIFKDPFNDFKAELDKIQWGETPTEEEMREFFEKNGNDIHGFIRENTIKSYNGIVKDTLIVTLQTLHEGALVDLWNTFIEEGAKYGLDSYIYDLKRKKDVETIENTFPQDKIAELTRIIKNEKLHGNDVRFFQWHNLNDDKIHVINSIENTIVAYWSDIFERIMIFPQCYNDFGGFQYFTLVFWRECIKYLGFEIDNAEIELKELKK